MREHGHKLTMTWSGEYGAESSSTGTCPCGWEESASSQREVQFEYRLHLERVRARRLAAANDPANQRIETDRQVERG